MPLEEEEDTRDISCSTGEQEVAICKPEGRLLPDMEPVSILILDFLASGTMQNQCLLFKPHSIWCFVIVG